MKQTLVQLLDSKEMERLTPLELLDQFEEMCQKHPLGSLAFHQSCPSSTATMEHPYLCFSLNYELAKREHLAFIEKIKANEEYVIERADVENLCYRYSFMDEHYGKVTYTQSEWLEEVARGEEFTEPLGDRLFLVTLHQGQNREKSLGAYQSVETALADVYRLLNLLKVKTPEIQIKHEEWFETEHWFEIVNLETGQPLRLIISEYPVLRDANE